MTTIIYGYGIVDRENKSWEAASWFASVLPGEIVRQLNGNPTGPRAPYRVVELRFEVEDKT